MKEIKLVSLVGSFAENKDIARDIRLTKIIPTIEKNQGVILNFEKIEGATQSFMHALISDVIRKYGAEVLDKIVFKNCNETVRKIIDIVAEYMQES
ncbi:MAG TPA: STAS-like domain-containing protein [Candidatus Nanoarchaeia archaeon]|nr:STAS-like domain-containing protein [Candidatus Nanoarchaeia archaeon]